MASDGELTCRLASTRRPLKGLRSSSTEHLWLPAEYPLKESSTNYKSRRQSGHRISYRKAIQKAGYNMNEILASTSNSPMMKKKEPACYVDWTEASLPDDHIWQPTSASGDFCYIGEDACSKTGQRKKCSACHIVVHEDCINKLSRIGFKCKSSFREMSSANRSFKEKPVLRHHWVHRRKLEGKCRQCGKSFEKRFGFRDTKIIAISCSWCKQAYHNKVSCFKMHNITDVCNLGVHSQAILPPTWVIKQTSQHRKSASRIRSKKKRISGGGSTRRKSSKDASGKGYGPFVVKPQNYHPQNQPIHHRPIIVFINPKSGGNQGLKLLHQFYNILNPRQVFDLTKTKPQDALEMFRKVPQVRVLACGGDGTVGWILAVLDRMNLSKQPPVAILPLGTGNDLSRTLNFGPGYTDESLSKILLNLESSKQVKLDRWRLRVSPNQDAQLCDDEDGLDEVTSVDQPPLDVINNYFSLGADAKVLLEFHNSREAKPEKFNSRIGNKMFYARAGVLEYLRSQTKDFNKHLELFCDGRNYTRRIREIKPTCLVFLNIPKYSSGTSPWGTSTAGNFGNQRIDDRLIEVIAMTANQLGMVQIGGHGERICQCRSATIKTDVKLPMQIDGEPFQLNPSNINVEFFKQSNVLMNKKKRRTSAKIEGGCKVKVGLVTSREYDACNGNKNILLRSASPLLVTLATNHSTLSSVRNSLEAVYPIERTSEPVSYRWVFLDASGVDKCYQVDRNQEKSLLLDDVMSSEKEVYVLDLKPPPPKSPTIDNAEFSINSQNQFVKKMYRRISQNDDHSSKEDCSAFQSGMNGKIKQTEMIRTNNRSSSATSVDEIKSKPTIQKQISDLGSSTNSLDSLTKKTKDLQVSDKNVTQSTNKDDLRRRISYQVHHSSNKRPNKVSANTNQSSNVNYTIADGLKLTLNMRETDL